MFNAEVSRLIASVITLACSVHVIFLRLHNVSFGLSPTHNLQTKYRDAAERSAAPSVS